MMYFLKKDSAYSADTSVVFYTFETDGYPQKFNSFKKAYLKNAILIFEVNLYKLSIKRLTCVMTRNIGISGFT
jgi:hypothetical protein